MILERVIKGYSCEIKRAKEDLIDQEEGNSVVKERAMKLCKRRIAMRTRASELMVDLFNKNRIDEDEIMNIYDSISDIERVGEWVTTGYKIQLASEVLELESDMLERFGLDSSIEYIADDDDDDDYEDKLKVAIVIYFYKNRIILF